MILVRCTEKDKEALKSVEIDPKLLEHDGINYDGIRVKKPWGSETQRYHDDKVAVWWLNLHSQQQTSMHCHPDKTTMIFVVAGRGRLFTLNGDYELSEGELVVIERGAFHQTASNNTMLVLYELESPPVKRNLVRLHDSYGRGQGYERVERPS